MKFFFELIVIIQKWRKATKDEKEEKRREIGKRKKKKKKKKKLCFENTNKFNERRESLQKLLDTRPGQQDVRKLMENTGVAPILQPTMHILNRRLSLRSSRRDLQAKGILQHTNEPSTVTTDDENFAFPDEAVDSDHISKRHHEPAPSYILTDDLAHHENVAAVVGATSTTSTTPATAVSSVTTATAPISTFASTSISAFNDGLKRDKLSNIVVNDDNNRTNLDPKKSSPLVWQDVNAKKKDAKPAGVSKDKTQSQSQSQSTRPNGGYAIGDRVELTSNQKGSLLYFFYFLFFLLFVWKMDSCCVFVNAILERTHKCNAIHIYTYIYIYIYNEGLIKYIGKVHFAEHRRYGIELDDYSVKGHDGSMGRHKYFDAKHGHGIFVTKEAIVRRLEDTNSHMDNIAFQLGDCVLLKDKKTEMLFDKGTKLAMSL
ncbi:hypothetical protein RFI_13416 [Reticulomyxa filosa]|uniref:CAP-Gly domain-containing protein n=1 Tax=Reticulomyxa filosa TaxID=46433 RepID=X6NBU2_RETFI|nr:hypothetical protein RFI_13416 [Reticulomyxa filosa]|eukprot:ETO23765.1 hypothetical protein RFI_13416 [Reticulomyxa filosa]